MTAQQITVNVRVKVRYGRLASLMQEAHARIRRAKKSERGAMMDRYVKRITSTCVETMVEL